MQTTSIARLSTTRQTPEIQFQEKCTRSLLSPSLEYCGTKKKNIPNCDKFLKYKAQVSMNNLKGDTLGDREQREVYE